MEATELTLWVARLLVLVLMYGLFLALIVALVADARAVSRPREAAAASAPTPAPARPERSTNPLTLVVTAGTPPTTGREYPLLGTIDIGRDASCTISIPSHFVSKNHARISLTGGQWVVEDLGSTNGSSLNDQPLSYPRPINPGDRLSVGDTEFLLK